MAYLRIRSSTSAKLKVFYRNGALKNSKNLLVRTCKGGLFVKAAGLGKTNKTPKKPVYNSTAVPPILFYFVRNENYSTMDSCFHLIPRLLQIIGYQKC